MTRCSLAELRKAAGSQSLQRLQNAVDTGWTRETLDEPPSEEAGKTALQVAAWKGCIENVRYLVEDIKCGVNHYSKEKFSYGKTPIFFAATQSRCDVLEYLLDHGAKVTIVNNKGQSPLSLAASHCAPPALLQKIQSKERLQEEQAQSGSSDIDESFVVDKGWWNFRLTHSDGLEYGDLDPRFGLDRPLKPTDTVTEYSINPTTRQSRKGGFARRNPEAAKERQRACQASRTHRKHPTKQERFQAATATTLQQDQQYEESWKVISKSHQSSTIPNECSEALWCIVLYGDRKRRPWIPETLDRLGSIFQLSELITFIQTSLEKSLATAHEQIEDVDRLVALLEKMLQRLRQQGSQDGSSSANLQKSKLKALKPPNHISLAKRLRDNMESLTNSELFARASRSVEGLSIPQDLIHHSSDLSPPQLRLAPGSVVWVDELQSLRSLHALLREAPSVIALDTEWCDSPTGGTDRDPIMATCQVSFVSKELCVPQTPSYVLDCLNESLEFRKELQQFLKWLLGSTSTLVLGFAMKEDWAVIQRFLGRPLPSTHHLLDIQVYLEENGASQVKGLKDCVKKYYDKIPLSKKEQCSEWGRRPLTQSQLDYAGLDAAILLYLLAHHNQAKECVSQFPSDNVQADAS